MNKRAFLSLSIAFLAANVLPAQRLAVGINDQPAGASGWSTIACYQAFRWQAPRIMLIVACEFWYGATAGTGTVMIFDHDAANDRPGNLLGSGTSPPRPPSAGPARSWTSRWSRRSRARSSGWAGATPTA